jgi:hypothetical protein
MKTIALVWQIKLEIMNVLGKHLKGIPEGMGLEKGEHESRTRVVTHYFLLAC